MARDLVPVFKQSGFNVPASVDGSSTTEFEVTYVNCSAVQTEDGVVGVGMRPQYPLFGSDNSTSNILAGRGIIPTRNDVSAPFYAHIVDTTYYYNGGATAINGGNGLNSDYLASFAEYNSGSPVLLIANAGDHTNLGTNTGNLYQQTSPTIPPTRITDVDMPGNNGISTTRGVVAMAGYVFLCDIFGGIYNSAVNDRTSWSALDFVSAERSPDVGVYLGKHHDHVVYIGTKSIEFFYLDPAIVNGSPLQRRTDVFYDVGTVYPNSVLEVGDVIYFLGTSKHKGTTLYKLENFSLVPIEIPVIFRQFASTEEGFTTIGSTNLLSQYVHLSLLDGIGQNKILYLMIADEGYAIDTTLGFVSKWKASSQPVKNGGYVWSSVLPIVTATGTKVQFANGAIGTRTGGEDTSSPAGDLSLAFSPAIFVSRPWSLNTDERKKINSLRIIAYHSTASFRGTEPIDVSWMDLDRITSGGITDASFSTPRTIDINKTAARLFRLGSTRSRIWRLDISSSTILTAIELNYEILRN